MNHFKSIAATSMVLFAAASAPVIPQDLQYFRSYETVAFNTVDGDLSINQYADSPGEPGWYLVRTVPKNQGNFEATTTQPTKEMKKVKVACEKCKYYAEFWNGDELVRYSIDREQYDGGRFTKNYPTPEKTIRRSLISEALNPTEANAAIAHDSASNAGALTSASSVSWSHTVTGTTNPLLVVAALGRDGTATDINATGVTYNGDAMTTIRRDANGTCVTAVTCASELFYLTAPDTGSAFTVSITYNGSCTQVGGAAESITGANQSGQPDANNGSTGTHAGSAVHPSTDVTTVADNSWVIDGVVGRTYSSLTVDASQTERYNRGDTSTYTAMSTELKTTHGATSMDWTFGGSGLNDGWAQSAASFSPAASDENTGTPSVFMKSDAFISGEAYVD